MTLNDKKRSILSVIYFGPKCNESPNSNTYEMTLAFKPITIYYSLTLNLIKSQRLEHAPGRWDDFIAT